jgi:2-polyprenyl-3-methyl-5-hydroxy-6-metoxy-1,4-benzoquinol methylase
MQTPLSNPQSAYHVGPDAVEGDIDHDIFEAMHRYMVKDLGLPEQVAADRSARELQRQVPASVLRFLSQMGVEVAGKDVLDLGAGLGGLSEELLLRGARVTSLEPGAAWAQIAKRRVGRHGGAFRLLTAFGEDIPLPSGSVDVIVSLQVLEHVKDPGKVLSEAWRVLRPGGAMYLACENYLAFREGHYQVPWLPLLPKHLGALYLRLLGRSPRFLREAVTYTTYPGVLRACRRLGFERPLAEQRAKALRGKKGVRRLAIFVLDGLTWGHGPLAIDLMCNTFKFGIAELFRKPS